MSLVIASNQDNEYVRDAQSLFTPWSFRNALSSTYKIPPNSQVCLQSAKVNLDGRSTVEQNNSVYYDWFGIELDADSVVESQNAIDFSTSYPIKQQFIRGQAQLTTDELARAVADNHREFHPNRMGHHDCVVSRTGGTGFNGYDFKYGYNACQTQAALLPTVNHAWNSGIENFNGSFSWSPATGAFSRIENASTTGYPSVAILTDKPLSTSNGSFNVEFKNANASGVPWGIALSRDCPNYFVNADRRFEYGPVYFTHDFEIASSPMGLDGQSYYEDFGVHRNKDGELVVRQSSWDSDTNQMMFSEVEYWNNASSDLSGAGRYDIDKNDGKYEWVEFRVVGEKVNLYIGHAGSTELVTQVDETSDKDTMFKPVSQTCWCLHPVLFVGKDGVNTTNSLKVSGFSGLNVPDYDSRSNQAKHMGWFERLTLGVQPGGIRTPGGVKHCRVVDSRVMNQPLDNTIHDYIGLNASFVNDYKPAMITTPNDLYVPTFNAAVAGIFGFNGRSLVNNGSYSASGSIDTLTLSSDEAPKASQKSIFVRLNGFGQQVMNARTGNKSTILSHLPTAEGTAGLFFYEPNRDVWLDLNNPYEISVSDISIDFVYSNEQYAKNLQGQSICVLYFREKPKS